MRPITNYDLYFWKYAIHNENLMRKILQRSTKSSTMMHDLVVQDFLNEQFAVPSLKEQKAIGNLLKTIDSLLTLHQRQSVSRSLPSRCSTLIYPRTLQGLPRRYLANQYPFNQSKRYGNAWNKTDKFIFKCHFFITPKVGSLDGFLLYCQNGCAVLKSLRSLDEGLGEQVWPQEKRPLKNLRSCRKA